jgi:hypothetical protein
MSAFGGKADMAIALRNVRCWGETFSLWANGQKRKTGTDKNGVVVLRIHTR